MSEPIQVPLSEAQILFLMELVNGYRKATETLPGKHNIAQRFTADLWRTLILAMPNG